MCATKTGRLDFAGWTEPAHTTHTTTWLLLLFVSFLILTSARSTTTPRIVFEAQPCEDCNVGVEGMLQEIAESKTTTRSNITRGLMETVLDFRRPPRQARTLKNRAAPLFCNSAKALVENSGSVCPQRSLGAQQQYFYRSHFDAQEQYFQKRERYVMYAQYIGQGSDCKATKEIQ